MHNQGSIPQKINSFTATKPNPDPGDSLSIGTDRVPTFNLSLLASHAHPRLALPSPKGQITNHLVIVEHFQTRPRNTLASQRQVLSPIFFQMTVRQMPNRQMLYLKTSATEILLVEGVLHTTGLRRENPPLNQNKIKNKPSAKKLLLKTCHKYLS